MTRSTRNRVRSEHGFSLRAGQRGIALIMVILVTAFLSALGMGVALAVFMDRLATGNMIGSVAMLYAADAGIEIAAHELAQVADWDAALSGAQPSHMTDGVPLGVRGLPGGGAVDLTSTTNLLNCGKTTPCTNAQMNANSKERPFGANNARWRLFAYGPMPQFARWARPSPYYLAVWLADDGREQDGDPFSDEPAPDRPGYGIVRVRAESYGFGGARRAIEAELSRICSGGAGGACQPGIRVQSWKEIRQVLP
jgi:Tfp pilus assembly protein PilX